MQRIGPTASLALLATLALLSAGAAEAPRPSPRDLLVVVNLGSENDRLDANEVRAIFLRQRTRWPDGNEIAPINPKADSTLRKAFRKAVLGMSEQEENKYWQDEKIRRGVDPPVEFSSPLRAIFRLRGAVSYVFRQDYVGSVAKVVAVIPAQ